MVDIRKHLRLSRTHRLTGQFVGLLAFLSAIAQAQPKLAAAGDLTGEQIYRQKCASCHGASGEGSPDNYAKPLIGDRTVPQLARFIAKTMPEDAPGECVGEDADKVAAYIHETFYSRDARIRNAPPRVELARLTVRQYRNAVADLIGTFREPVRWGNERGLKAQYYKSRRFRGGDRVIDRIDPEVRFDFGVSSPDPEKIDIDRFSIQWEGSVLATETGEYEFVVRTEHAARLWINDPKRPLIDAWVKSGDDTEYRASIFLLGGRAYTLRLDFGKGKQGDPDNKKDVPKPPPTKASIALLWKPPSQALDVIPHRNLTPGRVSETFAVTSPFPPDDRSVGYERGTSISKAWEQATTNAAIETSAYVLAHLRELSGASDNASQRDAKLREFCRKFAERAFRRRLTDEQTQAYVDRQFRKAPDPEPDLAVKRVILLVLKSPRFLYREIQGGRDPYDVASRLSFSLWDSLPDRPLLDAGAAGKLATREEVASQAERMVNDPRTHAKLLEFFHQWLKVDAVPDLSKDPKQFPDFSAEMGTDLRASLDLFLEDVIWGESSDFRQLMLADYVYYNGRLAKFYGLDLPADAAFQRVTQEPGERAGVLSHPYLMAAFSYTATSSPIHRGVLLARNVLGRTLRPPPEAFAPLSPELHPQLTTRERVTLQTQPQACVKCHGMINPLGFTLEHFDAVGRYRKEEKGKPIDASGIYQARSGETLTFTGIRDLATFLAASEETHSAFVERLFQYLVKQPVRAYGSGKLEDLRRSFAEREFNVRKLVVEAVTAAAIKDLDVKTTAKTQGTTVQK
jgi:cytochrome c553